MKKLGKLKLNPEKMLGYDELVSFKGGSWPFGDICPFYECSVCMGICLGDCAVNYEGDPAGEAQCETWCEQYCVQGA